MPAIIRNTPFCLVPKVLFQEELLHEYWDLLHAPPRSESLGKDDLENLFLLYPKPKNEDTVHEITLMAENLRENFSHQANIIFLNVYEEGFYLLVVKDQTLAFAEYFHYTVKEDILYHLANTAQQYFETISHVTFVYQKLPPSVLRLLNHYYEMIPL